MERRWRWRGDSRVVGGITLLGDGHATAKVNPITVVVDALRALCLGGPAAAPVGQALLWLGVAVAVTVPVAVLRYRRATTA